MTMTPSLAGFAFHPAITTYATLIFASSVDSVAVIASPTYAYASMSFFTRLDGGSILSAGSLQAATASPTIELASGSTQLIMLVVVAEDGIISTTYTISLHRVATDCTLSGLSFQPGGDGFQPAFSPAIQNYTVDVQPTVTFISFSAIPTQPAATMALQQQQTDSTWIDIVTMSPAVATMLIALPTVIAQTTTVFNLAVTAEDGVSVCVYSVAVIRLGSDASMAELTVVGEDDVLGSIPLALSPAFQAVVPSYSLSVANSVRTIHLTMVPTDLTISAVVTTQYITSPSVLASSILLPLNVSTTLPPLLAGVSLFNLVLTAADGITTKLYTILVTRASDLQSIGVTAQPSGVGIFSAWESGQVAIPLAVGFLVEEICITAVFLTPSVNWTIAQHFVQSDTFGHPAQLTSGSCSISMPLAIGTTTQLVFTDPIDPMVIQLPVVRAQPVISQVAFTVTHNANVFNPPAAFLATVRSYSGAVAYVIEEVYLFAVFSAGSMTVTRTCLLPNSLPAVTNTAIYRMRLASLCSCRWTPVR